MKMVRGWWWYLELFDSLRALSVFRYGARTESWNNLCKKGPWKVSSSLPLLKAGLPLKLDQVFEGLVKFWESPGMEVYFDRRGNRRNRHKGSSRVTTAPSLPQPMLVCLSEVSSRRVSLQTQQGRAEKCWFSLRVSQLPAQHEIQAFLSRSWVSCWALF